MALTYADWLTAITTILNVNDTFGIAAFNALVPRYIERAELYMYRDPDLDFLATRTVDTTRQTQSGVRAVAIPENFIIVEGVNLISPANTKPPAGKRIPLKRMNRSFLDVAWPTETDTQAPSEWQTYWALYSMFEDVGSGAEADEAVALPSSIMIAPTPDGAYVVEFSGVKRPTPLSATNPETFLTKYMPDLFIAASVVAVAAYQRDFGSPDSQQPDPSVAGYWQAEYTRLKTGAAVESARQASRSVGWSPYAPSGLANVPRSGMPQGPVQGG